MPGHANMDSHEHIRMERPKSGSGNLKKPTIQTSKLNTTAGGNRPVAKKVAMVKKIKTIDDKQSKQEQNVKASVVERNDNDKKGEVVEKNASEETVKNEHVDNDQKIKLVDDESNHPSGNTNSRFMQPFCVGSETETQIQEKQFKPDATQTPPLNVFTLEAFNNTIDNFTGVFSSHKFINVMDDYPTEEILSVIVQVKDTLEEFKKETLLSHGHLEELRKRMQEVKNNIQENVLKKSNALRKDEETQSIEDKEIRTTLARMNAQVAHANAELAEALRIAAESEKTVVEAQLEAEKANEEAQHILEEIAFRAKVEERRKEQEKKRLEEERKAMEEQKRLEDEERRQKELEWKRREFGSDKPQIWESWPIYEYKLNNEEDNLGCIIRCHPDKFNQNDISCKAINQLECPVPFAENEELVSSIIELSPIIDNIQFKEPIVVCIPYKASKQNSHGHAAKEPVIKVEKNGHWVCVETTKASIEAYKEIKFASTEMKLLTKMAVFSRLKRDYSTVSKRGGKVTSSYDQRISLTIPRNGIQNDDHIVMEVQPVDSSSVADLKNRSHTCRGLLTTSPIVHMEWESVEFEKPVTVTVPIPPNPIKVKKIAAQRKAKEEKMKNPPKVRVLLPHEIEAMEKEQQKSKLQKLQEQIAAEENKKEEPKQTKWYMGEYANNEDDESDNLYLVSAQGNKWAPVENVNIVQVKLDLLQFDLEKPVEKFMVLRTKTNVLEDEVGRLAGEVSSFLSQKFVQVILKQKSEDPFDTVMCVVPVSKTEKTLTKLSQDGYDDGPEPSQAIGINEGDLIEICFRGNVTTKDGEGLQFVYNSSIESETEFYACEVDKYLQKNFPVFRGVVEVYRKYKVKTASKTKKRDLSEHSEETAYETKRDLMCELAINIPKYRVEQNSSVKRAPVTIRNTTDPVNVELLRLIADELGDEWKSVAVHLNISKPRIQAIIRSMNSGKESEPDVRFDMLMTWLKNMPKAIDKVSILSNALVKSGRRDIAEEVRISDQTFKEHVKEY